MAKKKTSKKQQDEALRDIAKNGMPGSRWLDGEDVSEEVFEAHQNLLMDVIRRQAGTLGKAILEGVMNSVDAGASYCDIAVDSDVVIISDDGEGFPDEESVRRCFKTFGHDNPEEYAEKTYGNFRMGRGQMFAFGHNVWQSGTFQFDVDVKERGLKWIFNRNSGEDVDGCQVIIYLYNSLAPSEVATLERELRKMVKWVDIPVTFNDEQISQDPAEADWDYESDNCYVKLKTTGDLDVYNLGVFVKGFSQHTYGRGGEVVSKQQLKLNFARNDVMVSECPIWREVKKFVSAQAGREIRRKPALNDAERQRLADQLRHSDLEDSEAKNVKVFTDVLGRQHSLDQLAAATYKYGQYTNAPKGDRRGDRIHQQQLAFVFANVTLERFEKATAQELVKLLEKLSPGHWRDSFRKWKYKPFHELREEISDRCDLIDEKDYTEMEQVAIEICRYGEYKMLRPLQRAANKNRVPSRRIVIGTAESRDGWTDGETYIVLGREWLRGIRFSSIAGYVKLGELLLHEYCHDENDQQTHTHSAEFYQLYHDASQLGAIADFAEHTMRNLPKLLERVGKKLDKKLLRGQDAIHNLDQAAAKLEGKAARRTRKQ